LESALSGDRARPPPRLDPCRRVLAGAFWSKYAAVALATTLGLFLLFDPTARRAWRTLGPYVMALAFTIVIAPNAWWLVQHDFMPFEHVNARADGCALVRVFHFSAAMDWRSDRLAAAGDGLPLAAGIAKMHYVSRATPPRGCLVEP
jgi:Dolichyl-phosphate-mannose-protein mannosyltransferase